MREAWVWALAVGLCLSGTTTSARAQKSMTPSETVLAFYGLMRQQKFVDAFAYSVYAEAVDGLSEEDLGELAPEFQRTAADIPAAIEVKGEQVSGDAATVFARFGTSEDAQNVSLVRDGNRWLVGDKEALDQVRAEKTAFFFNARIRVDHNEVFDLMRQLTGTEDVRFQTKKAYGTLNELIAEEKTIGEELNDGIASGYKFMVNVTNDRQAFTVIAIPVRYGRTGKLSFFASSKSIHAADAHGGVVNEQSPVLVEDVFKNEQAEP